VSGRSEGSKFRRAVARRRAARRRRATTTRAEQERAALQRSIDHELRGWTKRRIAGWLLLGAAVVIGVQHWLAHLGVRPLPVSMSAQDLVMGYPTSLALGLLGFIILGARQPRRR